MPKSDLPIGGEYAPVADRIVLFYERYPEGRIVTQLTMHNEREIVFCASVYRDQQSRVPAATGWASERVGDGDINTVACLENTETSAIGRALANLGFTASRVRPSLEEMEKADRARQLIERAGLAEPPGRPLRVAEATPVAATVLQRRADAAREVLSLLEVARRMGFPPRRAEVVARAVTRVDVDKQLIGHWSRRLRAWVGTRRTRWSALRPHRDTDVAPA